MPKVVLVGHPNVGKSTLFNALTGGKAKVGNYPGVTVSHKSGHFHTPHGRKVELVDLPGCHSLMARAQDEEVTRDALLGSLPGAGDIDLAVVVVDASALERHLPLALQVVELGLPVLVVLNKIDVAKQNGTRINRQILAEELGLPVVALQADNGEGILNLKQALRFPLPLPPHPAWQDSATLQKAKASLAKKLGELSVPYPERQAWMLLADRDYRRNPESRLSTEALSEAQAVADQLASEGEAPEEQLGASRRERVRDLAELVMTSQQGDGPDGATFSDKLDSELLHPVRGWFYFAAIFFLIFWTLFTWAGIPMDLIEGAFEALGGAVGGLLPEGLFSDLMVDGIIAGIGGVVVFLPQILFLFFFLGILESTGYMARAAFLMDGVMSKVGLSGRSFLPLLSGYACAIPGVMATRSVPSARERLLTILILPWMSCSARLPVYLLLIPLLVSGALAQGLVLFGLYFLGTGTAFLAALLLRGRVGLEKGYQPSFLMEMPRYRAPDWSFIFRHLFDRAGAFLKKAGTVILALSIILWALATFPKAPSGEEQDQFSYSAMGRIGQAIEPVVAPLGWDHRLGTAMLASFAAREVFNSQVAISYAIEEGDDEGETQGAIREEFSKSYGMATVLSLLVFYVFALQCLPTTAVVSREANSWKVAVGQLAGMSLFAYFAALVTYQALNAFL
ncbi:ferrous iron transport protein B [Roseibacillus ishigakijimensis]|uniref:Ferrous iron transport protein B n=1 Tax=Roseibacillus ishigakijimensis TaxID=454146 RepID=A0A934VN10_9BACT|nr:ferrous iron transport protein B [Roseibacillus ishigakijimensis]MBK1834646.1 ferrous iron transport protein B [Roseibacillus ishigakijimensis]